MRYRTLFAAIALAFGAASVADPPPDPGVMEEEADQQPPVLEHEYLQRGEAAFVDEPTIVEQVKPPEEGLPDDYAEADYWREEVEPELEFDTELQAYRVTDRDDTFFFDGQFYRFDGDQWLRTMSLDPPQWEPVGLEAVPQQLRPGRPGD